MNDQMPLIHLDQMSKVVGSKDSGDTLALCLGEKPFVGCVSIKGTTRTVVIVVVLPLAKLRVE